MLNINAIERGTLSNPTSQAEISAEVMALLADPETIKAMRKAVIKAVGETGSTDDIVQDAVVRIIGYAETYDWSRGSFVGWACRIAQNLGRNFRKASANNGHESEEINADGEHGAMLVDTLVGEDGRNVVARRSEAAMLALALDTLRADERIFVEAMISGKTQTEAGALLGWSPATSTRRMRDIVAKVRQALADE